jgi:hypothetical protein
MAGAKITGLPDQLAGLGQETGISVVLVEVAGGVLQFAVPGGGFGIPAGGQGLEAAAFIEGLAVDWLRAWRR